MNRTRSRLGRRLMAGAAGTMLVVGVLAASTGTASAAARADTARLSKSALVSSTGAVVTPDAGIASMAAAMRKGTSSYSGARKATFAPDSRLLRPMSIIGTDDRFRITATTSFPASAIVLINSNGNQWCTGEMISKDTLLTAGHCVVENGVWTSGLSFTPGSNDGSAPYGTCYSRGTYAFNAWINSSDSNYDAAIVKLNCTVGYSTGWFGMWWQSAPLDGTFTRVQGYPGDKGPQQWESYGYVRSSQSDRIFYQNDTIGGESGSPVYQYRSGPYCSGVCEMAVHTNGVALGGTDNSGTRLTSVKFNAIMGIVNLP